MALIDDLVDRVVKRYAAAVANPINSYGKVNPDIDLRPLVYDALSIMASDAYVRGRKRKGLA